jgi:hypothetical protein
VGGGNAKGATRARASTDTLGVSGFADDARSSRELARINSDLSLRIRGNGDSLGGVQDRERKITINGIPWSSLDRNTCGNASYGGCPKASH